MNSYSFVQISSPKGQQQNIIVLAYGFQLLKYIMEKLWTNIR
jgi:hypothetical protein